MVYPLVAMVLLALLAAGCGSKRPATTSTPASQSGADPAFRYASCMRDHGVAGFPDPKVSSNGPGNTAIAMIVPSTLAATPGFGAAQKACKGILPAPGANPGPSPAAVHARVLGLVSFARCMRARGLADFPDPDAQGQLTRERLAAAGVDLHAHNVIAAARACVGASEGQVSAGDVARATQGGG